MPAADWSIALIAVLLGLAAGVAANRAAGAFPWPSPDRSGRPDGDGMSGAPVATVPRTRRPAVRPPVVEAGTALLFGGIALRTGPDWTLPALLLLAGAGVLLTVVDLQHRLLPDRVLLPTTAGVAVLLVLAAAATGEWSALLRAGLGGVALFAGFLVLALISPGGLGMGDVKLAVVLGLVLGHAGWSTLLLGAVAGFVVQAVVALGLLAARRVDRRSELPFGPAMLAGAFLVLLL